MFAGDAEIEKFIRENLYVAAVCDILDGLGYRNQAMHHRLRPLLPDRKNCGFVGRARTLRWMETDYINEVDPYGLEIEAVDSLRLGDVVVHSTDYAGTNAPWGELMHRSEKKRRRRLRLRQPGPRLQPNHRNGISRLLFRHSSS